MRFFRRSGTSASSEAPARERTSAGQSALPPGSVIGRSTRFRGEIRGKGPLTIRGQVEGIVGIEGRLMVENGGRLEAEVRVGEAVVAGSVKGSLTSRRTLSLEPTAILEGRAHADRFRISEGAVVNGSLTRIVPES